MKTRNRRRKDRIRKGRQNRKEAKKHGKVMKLESKTKRRKLRKKTAETRLLIDGAPVKSGKPIYMNLATTVTVALGEQGKDMLCEVKELVESGRISNLLIMAPGVWGNPKVRDRLQEMFEELGHPWAWNYVVFPLKTENANKFILRAITIYEITHYVDINKQFLTHVIHCNRLVRTKLFLMNIDSKIEYGWPAARKWLTRTAPSWWNLASLGDNAFDIIETGYLTYEAKNAHT